jgi:hypothetical protein
MIGQELSMLSMILSVVFIIFLLALIFTSIKVMIKIFFWVFIGIPVVIFLFAAGMYILGSLVLVPCTIGCISLLGGR